MTDIEVVVGEDLSEFKVRVLFEVYRTNTDGRKISSVGFFQNEKIAKGFPGTQVDSSYHKVKREFVLTNGDVGFVLGESAMLMDDEEAKLEIAKNARAKLTPEEAAALGLE